MENTLYSKIEYTAKSYPILNGLFPLVCKNEIDAHRLIWVNPNNDADFRITNVGIQAFVRAKIKEYNIRYPEPVLISSRIMLLCKKYILSPHYLYNNSISVFDERIAFELILFNGDLTQYIDSRSASDKIN
jgi:hypothetical protein